MIAGAILAVHTWRTSVARVLIIGASKGIGLETTRQALEAGHQVRALARSAAAIGFSDPKLEKVRRTLADIPATDRAAQFLIITTHHR
jgi:NAD(P)-dependent dehydrogenase (short-subunit alcohol dehydrogenase family)